MKRLILLTLVMVWATQAFAVEGSEVAYVSGTAQTLKDGVVGHLETASSSDMIFASPQGNLAIPYSAIQSFVYFQDVAHHLGVAPAIAVGLLKKRERKHFFNITWRDDAGVSQVAVFEVPKTAPRTLLAVLQARAPQARPPQPCPSRSSACAHPAH